MVDKLQELVDDVVNALENFMDRHEDRMIIGGPDWELSLVPNSYTFFTIHVDNEVFRTTIKRVTRSAEPTTEEGVSSND